MSPVNYAIATVSRTIGSFHPSAMPRLTRGHYRRELLAWVLLPVMMGTIEGGVVGVIAKNAFAGAVSDRLLNIVVAILAGAPAFANVTSFLWAALSHGRSKIPFLVGLQVAAVVLVAQIALAPASPAGLLMITVGAVGARVCWSGVVTLRATVWRANYPRSERATMAGKLSTVQALMMAGVGVAIGLAMRANDQSFHVIYPVAALFGLAGAIVYRRMRMRGHAALVSSERAHHAEPNGSRPGLGRFPALGILRADRLYRRYMIAMFVFGIGNIMVDAPLVIMLRDTFGYGYLRGILIVGTIPTLLMPLTIPLWSRLLDKSHIIRFRAYHCWAFVAATSAVLIAAVSTGADLGWMLWVAAALKGVAFGGGVLAWNLGHTDFAPKALTSQYMGIHVTLTGIRGLIAPAAAVTIYEILSAARPGSGGWVFAVCLALNLAGAAGFVALHLTTRSWTSAGGSWREDAGPQLPA